MLDKKGLYDLLDQYGMAYEAFEHPAVYSIEEMDALNLPHSERVAKNLFLRDDKKQHYYLVTVPGHKTVNLRSLREQIASRKLTFASEESLRELLMLEKGHVTPLGVLNNAEKNVIVIFDRSLQNRQIGIHPMENTATIFMAFEDVEKLIQNHRQNRRCQRSKPRRFAARGELLLQGCRQHGRHHLYQRGQRQHRRAEKRRSGAVQRRPRE